MAFREQLTSCPRCHLLISIESVMIDERATVRIIGKCTNPHCQTQTICRDVDPLQIAAFEASLQRKAPVQRPAPIAPGH
ncbi:MAG: hypothetical protein ACKV2V_26235 [Blastocatellia bacterium]